MPVPPIEIVPVACVDVCARIAARPPIAVMCRSMMERADGSADDLADSAAAGAGFGFGAVGFGAAGACAVCASNVPAPANMRTKAKAASVPVATPARDKVKLGIQELQQSTRIFNSSS